MIYVECTECGEEIAFAVVHDSDGDPSIPGGTRSWQAAELAENGQSCACDLSPGQWQIIQKDADRKAAEHVDAPDEDWPW